MKPQQILERSALVLTQAHRGHYFDHGYVGAPAVIGQGWLDRLNDFFSGGLDSFYTVLKNLEREKGENRIQHLLYVETPDVKQYEAQNENLKNQRIIENRLSQICDRLRLKPMLITTNLRAVTPYGVKWEMHHGSFYASVALSLDSFFKKVYIASTYTYATVFPWGSHPLLDPLWSNGSVELIHDGCEASRAQKIVHYISKSEYA